jgi:DNA-directed RNA polymerase alpha subunit
LAPSGKKIIFQSMEKDKKSSALPDWLHAILAGLSLQQCQQAIELLQKRTRHLVKPQRKTWQQKPVTELEISSRSVHALLNSNIATVGELVGLGADRIRFLRGCGVKSVNEIKAALQREMTTHLQKMPAQKKRLATKKPNGI